MSAPPLPQLTLAAVSRLVAARSVSPVELTQSCLDRIERFDSRINAFITVTADAALADARRAEAELARGDRRGPLHGVPIALKDSVDTAGVRTTAASTVFEDRVPTEDAEVVRRLRAAGAVIIGKLNLHEFAYGGSSVVNAFGPVRNPWNVAYSTGGSSGGPAAAVAAELCYGAIGTDTGGSIRQPAAYCGIVGLKPTYGLVSNRGVIPLAPSLDHVGPMCRTVEDTAHILHAIAGYDAQDPTSADLPTVDYVSALDVGPAGLRVGILRELFYESLDPDVAQAMVSALDVLVQLGASRHEVESLDTEPAYAPMQDAYRTILVSEAYAYHREHARNTPERYQAETLRRILAGADIDTTTYDQARHTLVQARQSIARVFDRVDLLVTPTAPIPPFTIADLVSDLNMLRRKEVVTLRNTRPFNLLALPTISVPCGFTRAGLPIGMQVSGPPGGDAAVLRLAHAYERVTDWHDRHPTLD